VQKVIHSSIILAILLVTTASNVQLWKCLKTGHFQLDAICAIADTVDTCCSQKKSDYVFQDQVKCCEKINTCGEITQSLDFQKNSPSMKVQPPLLTLFFIGYEHTILTKKQVTYLDNLPPPVIEKSKQRLYCQLSSFLC
jgi:hypothetical protein